MTELKRISCTVSVALLVLLSVASAFGSMSVAPLSLQLDIPPGDDGAGVFLVRNTGSVPIVVNISLHDWWRTPEGNFQILPAETMEQSCAPWTVYSASTVSLAPGEETQVSVQVSVPKEATGDHWALLLVEEQPQPVEEGQAEEGLTNTTRVVVTYAVKILQTDPVNDAPDASIKSIELVQTNPFEMVIHFANTGNAHITTKGTVEIRDIFGETVRSYAVEPFPTLPGEERPLRIQDSSDEPLPAGTYYAIALLDFGGEYLIQGGLPFEVQAANVTEGS